MSRGNAANSWQKKDFSNEKGVQEAWGSRSEGYSKRKGDGVVYESDAKALAGKEKREMEAMFGKQSSAPRVSSGKKWAPAGAKKFGGGGGSVPTMFQNAGKGGTLMTGGNSATADTSTKKVGGPTFGASAAKSNGRTYGTGGEVSKWSMGSSQTMDKPSLTKSGPTFGHDAGQGKFNGGR